jgi:hypothetical protein
MPGLVAGHRRLNHTRAKENVDGRNQSGHDETVRPVEPSHSRLQMLRARIDWNAPRFSALTSKEEFDAHFSF